MQTLDVVTWLQRDAGDDILEHHRTGGSPAFIPVLLGMKREEPRNETRNVLLKLEFLDLCTIHIFLGLGSSERVGEEFLPLNPWKCP